MSENALRILSPRFISELSSMELRARLIVEGFLVGLHKSPYHGFSVEFAEHRQYFPGDDISNIDWKVYARSERLYIKQYEEETNLKAYVLLDASNSMGFKRDGTISKLEYASYLAAGLIYLMMRQQDATGLVIYDEKIRRFYEPHLTYSYAKLLLTELSLVKPSSRTSTASALSILAERIKRRGLIILISDFLDDSDSVLTLLKHFRHKKNEVIAFHIVDNSELNFDFSSDAIFTDMETGEKIAAQPFELRKIYSRTVSAFVSKLRNTCLENNIDYNLISTSLSFDRALTAYLARRARMF